jgi:ribose 5-phosphate isomerase B
MQIGLAADHGGLELKQFLSVKLKEAGHDVVDFGAVKFEAGDDFPDYVVPLARAVASGTVERGIATCGSGVGACVAANKIAGARAGIIHEIFSAHQGVEDDDMNIICLGGRVIGSYLAWELVQAFLAARYKGSERFKRRLGKIARLENPQAK